MAETINKGWLKDTSDIKFAPKTLVEQVQDNNGKLLSVYLDELDSVKGLPTVTTNDNGKSLKVIDGNWKLSDGYLPLTGGTVTGSFAAPIIYEGGKELKLQYAYTGDSLSGNNQYSNLKDFVAATATDLNPRLFRMKDTGATSGAIMPYNNNWFRVITMYQNGYKNGNYNLDGNIIAFGGDKKVYYGWVDGKGEDDLSITWDEFVLKSQLGNAVVGEHSHTSLPLEEINTQPDQYTNHCILFGKNGRDKVEIYEYGGTLNLYKSANGTNTLILGVSPSGFTYNGNTVLTSGNWSSYAAEKSHTHNYAGSSSAGGAANSALVLGNDTRMNYGWNGINYFNIAGTAGNAAKVNDTPTTAWWHIMRFNHANSSGYYTDLAIPFNATSLYYKRITEGTVKNNGWVKVLDSLNWSDYAAAASHNHSAANITSGTLGVARGGTGATTFTSGAALIGNGTGAVTTRAITNMTSKSYINYNTNLMTTNTLAHWNGAFNASNTSNLTYCNRGAFGTIVTKATTDYLSSTGGAVNGRITSLKGTYTSTASNRFGNQALEIRENGHVGSAQSDIGYAPGIGFHWSGRCAGTLVLDSNARFQFLNQAGSGATVGAGSVSVSGSLSGSAATISGNATCGGVITSAISSSGGGYINLTATGALGFNGRATVPPDGTAGIRSSGDGSYDSGHTNYRWGTVYAKNGVKTTSDEREKDVLDFDLTEMSDYFMSLKPIAYRWNYGNDDKIHFGLGAQTAERSMIENGYDPSKFDMIQHDELEEPTAIGLTERYGITYQDFHMLTMMQTQKNTNEIDAVRAENEDLKARIEKLEKIIEGLCA